MALAQPPDRRLHRAFTHQASDYVSQPACPWMLPLADFRLFYFAQVFRVFG